MNNLGTSLIAILRLVGQNLLYRKWRIFTEVLLVMLTTFAFIVYGVYLRDDDIFISAEVEPLPISCFDVMVRLLADQRPLQLEEMPAPKFQREPYGYSEAAEISLASGPWGIAEIIGIKPDSLFFSLDEATLQGRKVMNPNEIVLPRSLATKLDLQLGNELAVAFLHYVKPTEIRAFNRQRESYTEMIQSGRIWRAARVLHNTTRTMQLVGIYSSEDMFTPIIGHFDELMEIDGREYGNAFLINYKRETSQLDHLVDWMHDAYPGALIYSESTPSALLRAMNLTNLVARQNLSWHLLLFMFIALYTISLMTFLERRGELASHKTIGWSDMQLNLMLLLEAYLPAIIGLLAAWFAVRLAASRLSFMKVVDEGVLSELFCTIFLGVCLSTLVVALFPLLTTRVASVNQLFFARNIPLRRRRLNYMENGGSMEIYRERIENLRLLQLPTSEDEDVDLLYFKQLGDTVKQGEVIAQLITFGGYNIKEWISPCDGTIVEFSVGGLVAIRPDNVNAVFHPYSNLALERGRQLYEKGLRK